MTSPNTDGHTFTITRTSGWSACLSRNRDENGNGTIDPEELKWYLPATDQLTGMFLGAESLITPLFDADSHPIGTVTTSGDTRYHYLLSDNRKLWAEEGASFGDRTYAGAPKEIRCVRNLNLKMNSTNASSETTKVGSVFTYDKNTRVFNLAQMDEKNTRGKQGSGELGLHDNFSITNRPYKAFKMAKDFLSAENGLWADHVAITTSLPRNHSKCYNYSESGNGNGKGKWRTPNQREFMIMYTQNSEFVYDKTQQARGYTRTEWKYNSKRHFGYNAGILFLDEVNRSYKVALRCVRDVDVDANGNIINDN